MSHVSIFSKPWVRKHATKLLSISSSDIDRFQKFFHWRTSKIMDISSYFGGMFFWLTVHIYHRRPFPLYRQGRRPHWNPCQQSVFKALVFFLHIKLKKIIRLRRISQRVCAFDRRAFWRQYPSLTLMRSWSRYEILWFLCLFLTLFHYTVLFVVL